MTGPSFARGRTEDHLHEHQWQSIMITIIRIIMMSVCQRRHHHHHHHQFLMG